MDDEDNDEDKVEDGSLLVVEKVVCEDEVDGLDVVDVDALEEVLAFMIHCLFWHEKPFGQQALPQVSSGSCKSMLCNSASGCSVAFWNVMSQRMGAMVLQSPEGQHTTEAALLNTTH